MIRETTINFANIKDVVDAAENLQRAGKKDDCEKILVDLAKSILGQSK